MKYTFESVNIVNLINQIYCNKFICIFCFKNQTSARSCGKKWTYNVKLRLFLPHK